MNDPGCSYDAFLETWKGHIPGYELDRELRQKICQCRCFACSVAIRAKALGTGIEGADGEPYRARLALLRQGKS